ncbi:MAG: 1-deoxy-D-xylulose-5-phosphate synthase [Clostridiales Family XIII bacterium]|jgi:1-deoxy-D-xylulose-5-phosphate synthase|nr:1-deoxy-D-xylulose-5-phosphate synthase [Clostridiales Family XIII bacterium]
MLQKDILDYIFPDDLREMSDHELELLAVSIRDFLITNVSATGGHLAPNLGVVELTIALHTVFDLARDSIVWDVGHQAYVHKILTGRASGFSTLRQYGGMAGFPRSTESETDIYSAGHSSTSISLAMGLAEGRDMRGEDGYVVAVIGDGSMTGGPAFEGLNNAGTKRTRMIVVLNDNNMSISHNVGSLSQHMNMLRSSHTYLDMKKELKRRLSSSHGIGEKLLHGMERVRDSIRYAMISESIFEDMGFSYFGPIDGHNISDMRDMLSGVKAIDGPVLLHVLTKKGKGYKNAENHPERFHGVGPFDSITGLPESVVGTPTWSGECGKELTRLAGMDDRVVAVTAAMADGTGLADFARAHPKRFFDTGIAESHAVTFASGLAMRGLRPFVAVYSTFLQRAYDQIIEDAALHELPVTFLVDRAGNVGEDGETHHGVFDLSFLGHVPNIRILAPSDAATLRAMLEYARANDGGPIAIRYPKGAVSEDIAPATNSSPAASGLGELLKNGKSRVLRGGLPSLQDACEADNVLRVGTRNDVVFEIAGGSAARSGGSDPAPDVTLLAAGCMAETALLAAGILEESDISAAVIDAVFVKPLDRDMVERAVRQGAPIVTIEDNVCGGGYGEAVNSLILEICGTRGNVPRVLNIGWPDEFVPHGARSILLEKYGLDSESIAKRVQSFLAGAAERTGGKEGAGGL